MSRARDLADRVLQNRTHEDTDGGRESIVTFKGEQSGGEISTLAQIQASHDGTADDEKADLIFKTNDGNDGASPTEAMRIDSLGNVGIGTNTIDVSTQAGGSGYKALQIESDEGGQINLDHNDAGTGSTLGQINFQRAGEVVAEIEGVTDGATDSGRIAFRTQPDGGALTEAMRIDHNGIVTKPKQPSFQAHRTNDQSNIAINSQVTVVFGTERFDVGGNFASSQFTAPATGKYQLNVELRINNMDTAATYYHLYLITSNRSYFSIADPNYTSDLNYHSISTSVLADMDENDTAYVALYQANGTAQSDISSDSNFGGILIG